MISFLYGFVRVTCVSFALYRGGTVASFSLDFLGLSVPKVFTFLYLK